MRMEKILYTATEVSEKYNIAVGTLANWRSQGRGPEYIKYGRKVLYPVSEMDKWLRLNLVRTLDSVDAR
jgi:hypothetical protein